MDLLDHDRCYRAVAARDARFDGVFFTAVRTTGIYCRPSCSAVTPRSHNVTFHHTAAAAQEAGYRACRRCRPDVTPGSPAWNVRADVVGRAMRLIGDGLVERQGVEALADRLGYSTRHLNRMMTDELGVGPLSVARSRRAHAARILVETTELPMADVAFASGFASIRQFNDTLRTAFDLTPTQMRGRRRHPSTGAPTGRIAVRLAVRQPFHAAGLLAFFADHAVPGVERVAGRTLIRVLDLPHGPGAVAATLHHDHVACELELADLRDTPVAVERVRWALDLDADPVAIDDVLGADPALDVRAAPGTRVPGEFDGFEAAVRVVVGQQVSRAGARTVLGRIVATHGTPVELDLARDHGLTHLFPSPTRLVDADPRGLGMPTGRGAAIVGLAQAVDRGDLIIDPGADRSATREALLAMRGIGPWTADCIVMRALRDPDVLLASDLVVGRRLAADGHADDRTRRWAPWRSYATMHLWRLASTPPREEPS